MSWGPQTGRVLTLSRGTTVRESRAGTIKTVRDLDPFLASGKRVKNRSGNLGPQGPAKVEVPVGKLHLVLVALRWLSMGGKGVLGPKPSGLWSEQGTKVEVPADNKQVRILFLSLRNGLNRRGF